MSTTSNAAVPMEMIIEKLNMLPHPEGGYYVETYRASENVQASNGRGLRSASTGILFLLGKGDVSHLHRIQSDEMWHFHQGATLTVFELEEETSTIRFTQLGSNLFKGERLQHVVKANTWFGAYLTDPDAEYGLVGCTVAPGFDFADFELAHRDRLCEQFPAVADSIRRLTVDPATLTRPAVERRRSSGSIEESLPAPGPDAEVLGS